MGLFDKSRIIKILQEKKIERPLVSGSPGLGGEQERFTKKNERKISKDMEKSINKRLSADLTRGDQARSQYGTDGGYGDSNVGDATVNKSLKKGKPFTKAESDAIQIRSLNKKTKQFVNKPGTTKSKGPGASTGGQKNLVVNPKSKGTTPVKVNITKPIKQSEVSKQAKVFTKKIDKKKIIKDADRLVRKAEKGDKKARKKIFKTVTKKFKKLSPADQEIQLTKMADIQKKMGRTFNPKTGNFEGPDTKFQKSISKIKGGKTGKKITSGPVSVTAGPKIRKRVETIRDTRATKAGMPDPFKSTTKAQTKFDDIFKGAKKSGKNFVKPSDPFKGATGVASSGAATKLKFQPRDISAKTAADKVEKGIKSAKKSFSDFSKKLSGVTGKKTNVNISSTDAEIASLGYDPRKKGRSVTKKYAPGTKGKVQMRGGATNVPSGPTTPPPKYDIPPDDKPGKLAQGRDFPSKKAYDSKLQKQVKILRGKADNLRKKQLKVHKTKPISGDGRDIERSKSLRKLGARMRERTKAADALERSLKRQGTVGTTSMLPVVSGKGADAKMPGMGGKTYKQFYKDANVGAYQPPKKIKSTPPPDPNKFKKEVEDTFKKAQKKASDNVTSSKFYGKYKDTARGQELLSKKATRLSRGFKGGTGKRAALGKFARSPLGKGLIGTTGKGKLVRAGLAIAGYYGAKSYLNRKDDLNINKDFAKTTTIKDPSGKNVRFSYSNRKDKDGKPIFKDKASSFLTKDKKTQDGTVIPGGLTKFRTGQYTANYKSGGKVGGKINIDKNMRSSAFEKQLQKAEKGTGFFGKQTQKDKDFLRKYKNATRPTAVN